MASVSEDINYWTITLKVWIADWVNDNAHKEEYGEEECLSCWMKLFLATNLIEIMQGYTVSTSYNVADGTTVTSDSCYTEDNDAQIKKIFQLASSIINARGGC